MVVNPDWRSESTVTVEEAGAILGVSRSVAYEAANAGSIPAIRVGRRLLIPVARLRALLGEAQNENSATAGNRDAADKPADGDGRHEVYER